eukprot:m.124876 g.124876  ORF g.124876 m.124876 type:complete len:345 (+) comp17302_c0_seq4:325-1359(+)
MANSNVDQGFEEMMEQMNIPESMREEMRQFSADRKLHMIGLSQTQRESEKTTPDDILKDLANDKMSAEKLAKVLRNCRVCLNTFPMSWIQSFCDKDGLNYLLAVLERSIVLNRSECEFETVTCIKAFMNTKLGLNAALTHENAMCVLAKSLNSNNRKIVTEVLRLLAAVCLVPPSGQMLTLEALTSLVVDNPDEGFRFRRLVQILQSANSMQLRVGVLQLINALVTSPEELDLRVHLRNELNACGFQALIPELQQDESSEMTTQLEVFDEEAAEDAAELLMRFDNVQFQLTDEIECAYFLRNSLVNTRASPYFLSILQHLCLVQDDHVLRLVIVALSAMALSPG